MATPSVLLRVLVLPLLCFSLAGVGEAAVPELIKDWLANQQKRGDVRIAFTQRKEGGALARGVETPGVIWRTGKGAFRWTLGEPPQSTLIYDGANLMLYEGEKWRTLEADSQQFRHIIALLGNSSADPAGLEKDFHISQTSATEQAHTFALMPKSRRLSKHLRQLDLQIAPDSKEMVQVRVIREGGGETLIRFSKPQQGEVDPALLAVPERS